MSSVTATSGGRKKPSQLASVVGTVFGNFMEFIDFGSYGFVAAIIGAQFFTNSSPVVQLLSSLAVFGVSFLFRPVGGALFGYIGDRYGRKTALTWSVILMSLGTGLIGCLPNHSTIGVAAPVLLVLLRAIQGVSVGGEFAGSGAYIVEMSPANRRGLWSSFVSFSSAIGTLFSSTLILILTSTLTTDAMNTWGWRIPFLLAFPIGAIGLYMRLRLDESPVYEHVRDTAAMELTSRNPYRHYGWQEIATILISLVFAGGAGLGYYFFSSYFNTYLTATAGLSRTAAIALSSISLLFYAALLPLAGLVSDLIGRKWLFICAFFAHAIAAVPLFFMLGSGSIGLALGALLIYAVIQSVVNVLTSTILAEMFNAKTRVSGGGIGQNVGVIIGGTGPFVGAFLVAQTHLSYSPGIYFAIVMAIVGIVMAFTLQETYKINLYRNTARVAKGSDGSETVTVLDPAQAAAAQAVKAARG
ncbi:MAG TPA: MFS transporter [Gryllotalpicola sp.]